MKKIAFLICFILPLFLVSCELDTYDLPGETLEGKLVDPEGNPLITEQPNGFKIRMYEEGSTTPYDFWGKPDGTFRNTKIFKAKYKIVPVDGAFFPVDTVEKVIKGKVNLVFEVTPFVTIDATITQSGANLVASYKIKKAPGAGKIQNARLLISKWNPNVGMNYNDKEVLRDLTGTDDAAIQLATYTDTAVDYLESGVTYYARVAVLSANTAGRYNFSPVTEIVVE